MDATELLGKALEIIERDGWHQGGFFDHRGVHDDYLEGRLPFEAAQQLMEEMARTAPVCSLGALARAHRGTGSMLGSDPVVNDAKRLLLEQIPESWRAISEWNDDKNTTLEDVKLAFKKAIEEANE